MAGPNEVGGVKGGQVGNLEKARVDRNVRQNPTDAANELRTRLLRALPKGSVEPVDVRGVAATAARAAAPGAGTMNADRNYGRAVTTGMAVPAQKPYVSVALFDHGSGV